MKHLDRKNTTIVAISLLAGLLTSFSPISEKEEAISRNVEALARGEGSSSIDCIYAEGKCIINNTIYPGMTHK